MMMNGVNKDDDEGNGDDYDGSGGEMVSLFHKVDIMRMFYLSIKLVNSNSHPVQVGMDR